MNETHRSANAILSRRGALRQLAAGAGLALAAAVPASAAVAAPAPAAPPIDPRLQEAFDRVLAAWEHIPEDKRLLAAELLPMGTLVAAKHFGGWPVPEGWLPRR